jgi:hypothetical protein
MATVPVTFGRESLYKQRKKVTGVVAIKRVINPDIAVAIYCGLQTLAATLVVCFETPVFLTGSQR